MREFQVDAEVMGGRRFVAREKELKMFEEWIRHPAAPSIIFSISGMGGIGKSALLTEIFSRCSLQGIPCVWVDARACRHTPTGFLEYLASVCMMDPTGGGPHPIESLVHAGPDARMVLGIDNFEALAAVEGWFREVFLGRLSQQGVAVLLASRQRLSDSWRHRHGPLKWVEWPLQRFSRSECRAYLEGISDLTPAMIESLLHSSNGHPLALALAADHLIQQVPVGEIQRTVAHQVGTKLLRDSVSPDLQEAVDVLTLVSVANQDLMNSAVSTPITVQQYHALAELPFLRMTSDGLALHDVARHYLLRDFLQREPDRMTALRNRLAAVLCETLSSVESHDDPKRQRVAGQLITLCLDAAPLHDAYADVRVDPRTFAIDCFRPGDLTALHKLLNDWSTYSIPPEELPKYHQFLEAAASEFPESLRIIRTSQGTPIAMFILMLVFEASSALLRRFFPVELSACCRPHEQRVKMEAADTYYAVLAAYDLDDDEHSGQELIGAFIRDGLTLLGEGTRVTLVATNADLKTLLGQLGFTMHPVNRSSRTSAGGSAHVLELDLRQRKFADWATSLLNISSSTWLPAVRVTAAQVREALAAVTQPAHLADTQIAHMTGWAPARLQQVLMKLLNEELSPLRGEERRLLSILYLECRGHVEQAAEHCNMSRATFYRHLRAALDRAAQELLMP